MRTHHPPVRSRRSRLFALLTTALVAASGLVALPATAHAAETGISNATLDWGFKASWRNYIANNASQGATTDYAGGASATSSGYNWGTSSTGSYDPETRAGSVSLPGSVHWYGFHGIDIMVTPTVTFDLAAGTGSILNNGTAIATFTTSGATVNESAGTVSVTGAASTATAGTVDLFGQYPAGEALDPVSFSFNYEVPATATTTTLSVDQASVEVGTQVNLTATVAPAAAGTVEFFSGTTSLGAPVTVASGVATLPVTLSAASHSVTAVFTSADAGFLGSTSNAITVDVTIPATAEVTTTTLDAPSPSGPVLLGSEVELVASVEQASDADVKPAGAIEFFSIADGTTDRTSIGTVSVDDEGVASITTDELAAGGHTFVAVFKPADEAAFLTSEAVTTDNYGVVDTAAPAPYEPGASAETRTGATASWDWSLYSYTGYAPWTKSATGNASVAGDGFVLTDGDVVADAYGAVVSFEAELTVSAHGIPMTLVNPAMHIDADGNGVWVANVNEGTERIVISTFAGANAQVGADAERVITFDFDGSTASGTWSAGFDGAWANGFVIEVPSSIRAFYYRSGDSVSNNNKAPSPLTVDFDWPAVSGTDLVVDTEGPVELGEDVSLTATVGPKEAEGSVTFYDISAENGETVLGTETVSDGVATHVTNDLVAGGHTFRAEYTSTNGFTNSQASTTANFGVVDTAQPEVCAPVESSSETLTGVTATWGWSAYSNGSMPWGKIASGNVSVEGTDFVLKNGVATVSDDCVSIAFTGTLRTEAYQNFFPTHGQWVELVDPVLTIDAAGNGAWSAGVRTGISTLNAFTSERIVIAAVADAAGVDFGGNSVNAEVELAYADTTAEGTWSAGYSDAWSNAFVRMVPDAIRSFYYTSGTSLAQANKPPAPIQLDWALAAPSGSVNGQSEDARVLQGQNVTFTASPFRAGDEVSIVVNSDPVHLPTVTVGLADEGVVTQNWKVPADFATGDHTVTFSTGSGANARTFSMPFTVEAVSTATGPSTANPEDVCVARAVTGGSMNWEFKQSFKNYIQGPLAKGTFSGGSFSATGGSMNVEDGGIGQVNFSGSLSAAGHGSELNIQIQNPSVQVTGPNSGVLYGTLSGSYVAIANLSFSSVAVSSNAVTATGSSATLTGAAAAGFRGFYSAGTELDPVSFSVSLGAEVPCDETTDPVAAELARTGADGNGLAPLAAFGALTLLLGFGLFRARRRQMA